MKKLSFLIIALLIVFSTVFAQSPQAFKYQAVARDNTGAILVNQNVGLRISILKGDITGNTVYSEVHTTQTNSYGLINLVIGKGTVESGDFSAINWGTDDFFVKIEIDATGGTNYTELGTSQLLSVPYSLHSVTSEIYTGTITESQISDFGNYLETEVDGSITNELQDISLSGNKLSISNGNTVDLSSFKNNWDSNLDTISTIRKVKIGGDTSTFAPALEIYGTNGNASGATVELFRDLSRNNVLQFSASDGTKTSTFGLLGTNMFGYNFVGIGLAENNAWTNPFKIEFGATNNSIYIKSNGNVGIGTSTPSRKLQISDAMRLEPLTTAPSNPQKGDIYFGTDGHLHIFNGTAWFSVDMTQD